MFPNTQHCCWLVVTGSTGRVLGWFLLKTLDSMGEYQLRVCPSQNTGHETSSTQGFCKD